MHTIQNNSFVCPMHPEVTSHEPGVCPKCGTMRLVPRTSVLASESNRNSYKPLVIIIMVIIATTAVLAFKDIATDRFMPETVMANFMAGFFLVFSGFKLLDIKGFAQGYATYDLLARRVTWYGYIYPFIELTLGLLFLVGNQSFELLWITAVLMGFSGLGVTNALFKKQKIQCACLGTVIKLPLTSVAVVEDFGMMFMTIVMIAIRILYN